MVKENLGELINLTLWDHFSSYSSRFDEIVVICYFELKINKFAKINKRHA